MIDSVWLLRKRRQIIECPLPFDSILFLFPLIKILFVFVLGRFGKGKVKL